MKTEEHYFLGKVLKSFGIKGELLAFFDVDNTADYTNLKSVFVFIGGNMVPFSISELRLRQNNQVQIRFKDIDDPNQAEILIGCELYLPLSALPPLADHQFYYHEIVGYQAFDEAFGYIGTVDRVIDFPMQALLQVSNQGKEILIPLVDEVIVKVDKKKREIYLNVPEGLIELYLN